MDKISTTGVIDQTIYSDGGNVMYIVNVELNGKIIGIVWYIGNYCYMYFYGKKLI